MRVFYIFLTIFSFSFTSLSQDIPADAFGNYESAKKIPTISEIQLESPNNINSFYRYNEPVYTPDVSKINVSKYSDQNFEKDFNKIYENLLNQSSPKSNNSIPVYSSSNYNYNTGILNERVNYNNSYYRNQSNEGELFLIVFILIALFMGIFALVINKKEFEEVNK